MKHGILSRSLILGSALMLAALDPVIAGKGKGNGEEPLELLINFDIVGTPVGPGLFEINGLGGGLASKSLAQRLGGFRHRQALDIAFRDPDRRIHPSTTSNGDRKGAAIPIVLQSAA